MEKAIERLEYILPIKRTLDELPLIPAQLYLAVVNSCYEKGRALLFSELEKIDVNARV